MADASHSELISKFSAVTGVDAGRAQFYLESAAWQLDMALGSFYEDDDDDDVEVVDEVPGQPEPATTSPQKAAPPTRASQTSRFGTIASMQEDEDSDEEQGEAFYAGGSETSGQQVLGPPKKKQSGDELVKTMFKAAKEHGAEVVEAGGSGQPSTMPTFRGTGYRLGDTEEASPSIAGAPLKQENQQVGVILKLWKNGFSVDSGPLRDYHDSANKDFLDSIHKGEVPRELLRLAKGGEVNLNMEDHRTEEFVQARVSTRAFTGQGNMLGSVAPTLTTGASPGPSQTEKQETSAKEEISVDTSQPTTNVQIRLADGSRMVAKFNHSHTVADVRNYIRIARPQSTTSTFILLTTFPNKELTDETSTLEEAKLLNAVIVQRMK